MGTEKGKAPAQLKAGALGFWDCFSIAVGGMVGMAIFSLSGMTYSMAGGASLLSWAVAGLIVVLYAFNVAELTSKFPKCGGIYVYPTQSLGTNPFVRQLAGWLAAWSWLSVTILGTAFGAIYVSYYMGGLIPALASYQIPVALVSVLFVYVFNALGVRLMGKTNIILTLGLGIAIVVFVIMALPRADVANFTPFFAGTLGLTGFFAAIPIAMNAYNAVVAVSTLAEEIRDVRRTIPKVVGWSMLTVIIGYCLTLYATYGNLAWQSIPEGSWGYYAPLHMVVAAFGEGFAWLTVLVNLAAVLAILTTMLILISDAGRTSMALGRTGLFPKVFATIHPKTQTPVVSLTIMAIASGAIACAPGFTSTIINAGSFNMALVVVMVLLSVIGARITRKDVQGTYKTPGGYTLQVLTILAIGFLMTQLQPLALKLAGYFHLIGLAYFLLRWSTGGVEKTIGGLNKIGNE